MALGLFSEVAFDVLCRSGHEQVARLPACPGDVRGNVELFFMKDFEKRAICCDRFGREHIERQWMVVFLSLTKFII